MTKEITLIIYLFCKKWVENLRVSTRLTAKRSGFSAVGSAHVWGARGRWFESSNPDQKKIQVTGSQ